MKAQLSKLTRVFGLVFGDRRRQHTRPTSGWVVAAILTASASLLSGCQTTPLLPAGPIIYYRQIGACDGTAGAQAGLSSAFVVYQIDTIDNEGSVPFAFDPTKLSANASPAVKIGTMPPVPIPLNLSTTSPILSALNVSPASDKTVAAGQQSDLPPAAFGLVTVGTGASDGAMEANRARYFLIYATPANDPPVIPTVLGLARTAWPHTPDCADIRPNRGQNAYQDNFGTISTFKIDPTTGLLKDLNKPVPDTLLSGHIAGQFAVDPRGHFLFGSDTTANELLTFKINPDDGSLNPPNQSAVGTSGLPFNLVIDPAGRFVYVTVPDGIDVFRIDPATGTLTNTGHLNVEKTESVVADGSGGFLYVLASKFNLTGETLTAYAIDPSSGMLSQVNSVPTNGSGGGNYITINPLNGYLYLAGGYNNAVQVFVFTSTTLAFTEPVSPTPVSGGASSLTFDASGGFLYVANGLGVSAFKVLLTGALQSLPAPTSQIPTWIYAEPTGRFIYIHNEPLQSLTVYRLNPITGVLTPGPKTPLMGDQPLMIPGTY